MGRPKMTKEEKYLASLERMIKNPPIGFKVVYDYETTSICVVEEDAVFHDNEVSNMSAIVGSTTPLDGRGYGTSTGLDRDSVIGTIYVNMEAVQR